MMTFSWIRSQASPEADREFAQGFGLEVPESMGDQLDLGDQEAPAEDKKEEEESKFQVTGGENQRRAVIAHQAKSRRRRESTKKLDRRRRLSRWALAPVPTPDLPAGHNWPDPENALRRPNRKL